MSLTIKTSYKFAFLSILSAMSLNTGTSNAQMNEAGNTPQFLPSAGWQVQETALSSVRGLQDINLPCMMATTYNNGFMLRFSGSDDQIMAMAIDFRQDVFVQGRKYPTNMLVGDGYSKQISGTAFTESVLIFNMRPHTGFYAALADSKKMVLDIEQNPILFSLNGVSNGLQKLQSCSTGGDFTSQVQEASIPSAPPAQAMTWDDKVEPQSARVSKQMQKQEQAQGQIWEARAGDDLKATLEGWANRAGVALDWQATGDAKVADDLRVQGSFEEAVQNLMARNAAALGLDANMMGGGTMSAPSGAKPSGQMGMRGMQRVSMPVDDGPQQLIPSQMGQSSMHAGVTPMASAPTQMSPQVAGGKWSAPMGTSLQQVLQTWSKQAGVEVIWQSNQGFAVKQPISMNGSYEAAIQSLLEQYTNERIRPNAQLNNDPITGRRTLFIESSRVL